MPEPRRPQGSQRSPCSGKETSSGLLAVVLLHCFDRDYSVNHTVSARVFVLMKIQAGLFCGCLVSFLLS